MRRRIEHFHRLKFENTVAPLRLIHLFLRRFIPSEARTAAETGPPLAQLNYCL